MATFPAIAATTAALLKLLNAAAVSDYAEGDRPTLLQLRSADLQQAGSERMAVSLYLYHVGINASRRTAPDRWDATGRKRPSLLPLDLHYLMTAWARDAGAQQRLLGWAMRVIHDMPTLPAGLLNSGEAEVFDPAETVEVIWESLSPRDLYDIWDVARRNQQPSAAYVARVVEIESALQTDEGPLVQTRDLRYGQVPA
jgi:Pvc16 N-terminal domain